MTTGEGALVIRPCRRALRATSQLWWTGITCFAIALVAAVLGELGAAAILVLVGAVQVIGGRRGHRARVEITDGQVLVADMWFQWAFPTEAVVGVAVDRRWVPFWAVGRDPFPPTFRPKDLVELILEDGSRRFPSALRRPADDPETRELVERLLGALPNAESRPVA